MNKRVGVLGAHPGSVLVNMDEEGQWILSRLAVRNFKS